MKIPKRERHAQQASGFLIGWLIALGVGVYLGVSGHARFVFAAILAGFLLAAAWFSFYRSDR